jgi:acyl-CoA synthetase (NDP forming)
VNEVSAGEPDLPLQLEAKAAAVALASVGIPLARQRGVDTAEAAVAAAREVGFPVAVKLSSAELIHKSDHGGVLLGLADEESVTEACASLADRARTLGLTRWQLLVQEMLQAAELEVYVGAKRDPVFGIVVLAGPGGRLVELLGETAIRLGPLDAAAAKAMVQESALGRLANGYRGGRPLDVDDLAAILASLSRLMEKRPDIAEVDLNPLLPDPDGGFCAVDARVMAVAEDADFGAPRRGRPPDHAALEALFSPKSVVVIGASQRDARKPGSRVLGYLRQHGYEGALAVVHPEAERFGDVPCHPSVAALPDVPDLACIAVPRDACPGVLEECGAKGIRAAIVYTAGFSEGGDEKAECLLRTIAERHSMAMCGPNTIGIVNTAKRLHASFSQALETQRPVDGRVAIISQSGALGGSLLSQAWGRGLGIGRFVSVGNQAALSIADVVRHLAGDPDIDTVCVLLEGVDDGQALQASLEEARRRATTVVALKVGQSRLGAEVARSHTAVLAGDARVYDAVLRQAGAVRAGSMSELLDIAELIERGCRPVGGRMGIVSTSGGACSLLADACEAAGLSVPALPAATRTVLAERLPDFSATRNPVDVTAQVASDPELLVEALEPVASSGAVDAVLVVITAIADPQADDVARPVARVAASVDVPVIVVWTIDPGLASGGLAILRERGVPVFAAPEPPVRALGALVAARPSGFA